MGGVGDLAVLVDLFAVLVPRSVASSVDIREHEDERRHDETVENKKGYKEVPDLAEVALCVDQIPLDLHLVVDDGALLVDVLSYIVYHHLLQIALCHLL